VSTGATWRAPDVLLLAIAVAVAGATLALSVSGPSREQQAASQEMQSLLGGLGLGRAVHLGRCVGAYDPRLGASCDLRDEPIPGAEWMCPDHALPRGALR